MLPLLACLTVLVALGVLERTARDRAWRSVPIRVHVNGTRGKSTVTRLIWSALREAGVPSLAKTTGTAPRLLMPDGTERPLNRRAPASIREQLELLRLARRIGARAVIAECMAIHPELQWISEHQMLRATVGVLTNVRPDHTEVMGSDLEDIAASLANTVPCRAVLVTGEAGARSPIAIRAGQLKTSLVVASCDGGAGWLRENERTALAVTRHLGIPDEVAERGFAAAPRDPGFVASGTWGAGAETAGWVDATAANDPVSLAVLLGGEPGGMLPRPSGSRRPLTIVYNNRVDRAARLGCFARHSSLLADADSVVITGDHPPMTVNRLLRRARTGRAAAAFVPTRYLAAWLLENAVGHNLVFCGNTRGISAASVISEAGNRD